VGQVRLDIHVIQISAAVLIDESPEDIEVEKVGALKQMVAVEKAGGGKQPGVDRPDADSEDKSIGREASRVEPQRGFSNGQDRHGLTS
jgi:hypothetical protein